jgi:hypothetical protein
VGGSFRGRLTVSVDGQLVGSDRHEIDEDGGYVDMGHRVLRAGPHVVTLDYGGPDLHPGSAGPPLALGPVVLGDQTADRPVAVVRTADARTLCGHRLDWVEALPAVG